MSEEKKYLIVIHNWHVYSQGFKLIQSDADTEEKARIDLKVAIQDNTSPFSSCQGTIIPVTDSQHSNYKLSKIPMWIRRIFNAE